MKLLELITPITNTRNISVRHDLSALNKQTKKDVLSDDPATNGGAYAIGKQNPKDPHDLRKKLRMPSNLVHDAYYQYTKAIEPYVLSNPYLPRIYSTNLVKDPDGIIRPNYRMEMLQQYDKFSAESLVALGERMFPGFEDMIGVSRATRADYVWLDIMNRMHNLCAYGNNGKYEFDYGHSARLSWVTQDRKLLAAAELITKVLRSNHHFTLDLNTGNAMIRTGSHGLQLVITDPLSNGGESLVGGSGPFSDSGMADNQVTIDARKPGEKT